MLVLGIESSCDETAAAVVAEGRRVRSSVVASQDALHVEYGGVVPELASRAHVERMLPVIREAVDRAGVALTDLDAIAVGHRPGLIGSLVVGVSAAKGLAWSLGVPIIGVDHVHAHLYAGCLDDEPPPMPALGLVVSGGHTALYRVDELASPRRIGSTIDDAAGEAFDKAASLLGLPYPGGPALDRLASQAGADDRAHDLPISRLGRGSLDFSFSGLKTAALYTIRGKPGPGGVFERDASALSEDERRDIAASFQRAVVRAIILKLTRAHDQMVDEGEAPESLLTGGGVTANSHLRGELEAFARDRGLVLRLPAMRYCVDNAAMIAGLGALLLDCGERSGLDLTAVPTTAC